MLSTIRARLFWLVVFALLPAIAILAYDELRFRQSVFDKLQEDAARVVALTEERIESDISSTRSRLRLLALLPEIRAMDASANSRLAEVLSDETIYTSLVIADPDGRVVCSAIPFQGEVRLDQFASFSRAVASKSFSVGKYNFNPISSKPGVNVGYPLLDQAGSLQGVLVASLGFAWIGDFIAQADLPKGATLLIVDTDGVVLARTLDPTMGSQEYRGGNNPGDV